MSTTCGKPIYSDALGPIYSCGFLPGHEGPCETLAQRRLKMAGKPQTMTSLEKIQAQLDALTAGVNSCLAGLTKQQEYFEKLIVRVTDCSNYEYERLVDTNREIISLSGKLDGIRDGLCDQIRNAFDAIAKSHGEMNRSLNDGFEAVLKSKSKPAKRSRSQK